MWHRSVNASRRPRRRASYDHLILATRGSTESGRHRYPRCVRSCSNASARFASASAERLQATLPPPLGAKAAMALHTTSLLFGRKLEAHSTHAHSAAADVAKARREQTTTAAPTRCFMRASPAALAVSSPRPLGHFIKSPIPSSPTLIYPGQAFRARPRRRRLRVVRGGPPNHQLSEHLVSKGGR